MQPELTHIPVLKREVVNFLNIHPDGIYLDGTVGLGGHASAIQSHLSRKGILVVLDGDEAALEHSEIFLSGPSFSRLFHDSYNNFPQHLESLGIQKVDGMFLDLGLSSHQLDSPQRGFSYRYDGPLDMRFSLDTLTTASHIVNGEDEFRLKEIIRAFGEERQAGRIARAIVEKRKSEPIQTTFENFPSPCIGHGAGIGFQVLLRSIIWKTLCRGEISRSGGSHRRHRYPDRGHTENF